MLSLEKQNKYRILYKNMTSDWKSSVEVYHELISTYAEALLTVGTSANIKILDIGCGAGGVLESPTYRHITRFGVDIDHKSLVRHRDNSFLLACSDASRLPFPSESFDLVVSSWVFEHISSPHLLFLDITRVLKRNGHLVFITPNRRNVITIINRITPEHLQSVLVEIVYGRKSEDTFQVHYRANSVDALKSLADQAGLRPVAFHLLGDPTYLAFNSIAFHIAVGLERLTPTNNKVHIVGDLVKP